MNKQVRHYKKTPINKQVKYVISRGAKKIGLLHALRSISKEKYAEKISASLLYGILSSIAVNFFFQPGHVYASGATGLAQVISALSKHLGGFMIPVALAYYVINIPLMLLAWYRIGHKFTIFTFITVTMSSLFIQIMPAVTLTQDPLINAIFGGLVMGLGIGLGLKSRISSGGTDIVSLTLRQKTGRDVGSISFVVNGLILVFAGILFGWQYALYSMVSIFVSSRVTDAIFTKQKKMQAMIVTEVPEKVISAIHHRLNRGVTCINNAEGTYNHHEKFILITILTHEEYNDFKALMMKVDPKAFVSIAENVRIIGKFIEDD
ncbi:YitT family protein [Streptococcus halichoeri]|uniref:YitT family protein n=1 Tax=Streptococcus halichoeri TaxID=254785 RepID=UPI00135C8D6E|nr:YitT family protein [Streptococcus halichoeri]